MLKRSLCSVSLGLASLLVACGDDSQTPPTPTGSAGTEDGTGTSGSATGTTTDTGTATGDESTSGSTTEQPTTDVTLDASESESNSATEVTDTSTTSGDTSSSSSDSSSDSGTTQGDDGSQASVEVGDGQTGFIDQRLLTPIVVRITDDMDNPVQGAVVRFVADPGAATTPTNDTTDMNGEVVVLARLGRALGVYNFTANVDDSTASATFSGTAIAPPDGTGLTLVNVTKVPDDNVGVPGPGTIANIGEVRSVNVASDDTVFVTAHDSGNGYVYALDPAGELTVIAGGGGDALEECIPPADANLGEVEDVEYDEGNNTLYLVADYIDGWRVLTIDLDTDLLCTFAGGNELAPSPQYGDGGLATDARLVSPGDISIGPDGALYIADRSLTRIRRVALGVISEYLSQGDCDDPVALQSCTSRGCDMAWDDNGSLFINARICGTEPDGQADGIIRHDPMMGSMTHIAGLSGGSQSEPVLSFFAELDGLGGMAFDEAGNLFVVESGADRVRRIDATTFRIETVMNNTGTPGQGVDYTPATGVLLSDPVRVAFSPLGDLFVADSANAAVRMIWGAGDAQPIDATLSLVAGDNQTVEVDQRLSLLTAQLEDGGANPLEGLLVRYQPDEAGGCVDPGADLTDGAGIAATFARPGLASGPTSFTAFYDNIHGIPVNGSPITINATVVDPTAGTIFTSVNTDHTPGNIDVPGAGTCARVGDLRGVTTAPDGSVYYTDFFSGDGRLRVLDPAGDTQTIAGGGGASVDGVPALDANLTNIHDALYDGSVPGSERVFITGTYGGASRILRVSVNAATPFVFVFGGQTVTQLPPHGDGNLATEAYFVNAGDLSIDPTNPDAVYVVDAGHDRIRVIENFTVNHFYGVDDGDCGDDLIALNDCAECNVAWDSSGNAYVSGRICGDSPGGSTPGIVRLGPGGTNITHLVGSSGGSTSYNGVAGTSAELESPGGVLVGSDGLLYFTDEDGHRVNRIPTGGGNITIVAGDGAPGSIGNYGPASGARVNEPLRLAESPGDDLLIADSSNGSIRVIWDQF